MCRFCTSHLGEVKKETTVSLPMAFIAHADNSTKSARRLSERLEHIRDFETHTATLPAVLEEDDQLSQLLRPLHAPEALPKAAVRATVSGRVNWDLRLKGA